jgi:PAS domain S-box-containing protein
MSNPYPIKVYQQPGKRLLGFIAMFVTVLLLSLSTSGVALALVDNNQSNGNPPTKSATPLIHGKKDTLAVGGEQNYPPFATGLRDVLKYLLPVLLIFLGIAQYSIYRRKIERKAAQKALQESEAHLRLSQISGGIGTWEADLVNHTQKWSENCFTLLGLAAHGNPTWDDFIALVHPEDRQRVIDAIQSHIEHNTPFDVEYRIATTVEMFLWMRSTGQVERDADGKPVFMRGIAHNITERKKLELQLAEKTHHFSTLLSTTPAGVFETNSDGECTYVNERWSQITGMSFEFARGIGWANALHPEDRASVYAEWTASVAKNRPFHLEYRFLHADGSVVWVLGQSVAFQSATEVPGFVGSITDITARKLAEQALQKSEHILSKVLENVDAYIYLKDAQGRYLYANRKVCDLFGKALEAIVGESDEQFFDAQTVEQIQNNDRQVLLEGKTVKTEETNLVIKNGLPSTYLSVKLPIRNDAGEIYALCGISTEITERKLMEMQLIKNISLLHATLESTNDAILVVDMHNTWLLHNQRFIDLWHITDDMIAAKDDGAALSYVLNQLEDADTFLNKVHALYTTPEASSFDTLKFKNGKVIEQYSTPQIVGGEVVGRVWSFRDVTERKQAEAKLIQRENYSRAIIEASPVPLALNDDNGNITYLLARV